MTDLIKLSLAQALDGLRSKKFSATELVKSHIAQIEKQKHINAYITITDDLALKAAQDADNLIACGQARAIEGIPISIKDLYCTKGITTTAASKMLYNFVPTYSATAYTKIITAGGIMLGKGNMDEFAMGSANLNSYFGKVINPWQATNDPTDLTPGGSSGGSSAAVASFMAMAALGSDTGGSVRQPAAYTGTVGVKPSYGRCSRWGMIAFASSLDQAGIITRTVEDAAIMLEIIMGFDPKDPSSANIEVPNLVTATKQPIKNMKIGVPHELIEDAKLNSDIISMWNNTIDILKQQGAEIIGVNFPHINHALPVYYVISSAEASSNLARYDGVRYGVRIGDDTSDVNEIFELSRSHNFGTEVKRRIMMGAYALLSTNINSCYTKAQQVRKLIANDFTESFKRVDCILMPSTPTPAFPLHINQEDPVTIYLNDILTVPASLAGLPAISVPSGLSSNGLPLGMQVISSRFNEYDTFRIAAAIERGLDMNLVPHGF